MANKKKKLEATKSLGGTRHRADLGKPEKWALDDVAQFGQTLLQFEKELEELREHREAQKQMLREIQSNMLKGVPRLRMLRDECPDMVGSLAGTRKEEISRFNKAKTDKEFAKMLKSRTLGPEHLETQTQLRRSIRVRFFFKFCWFFMYHTFQTIRDRIQRLEENLKASKKKLNERKSGRPSLKYVSPCSTSFYA